MLHIDGSEHRWFGDERYYELIVALDDATIEIYYAQLVEAESTRTVMAALREVVETRGLFCSLYSNRADHFFLTPKLTVTAAQKGRAFVRAQRKDLDWMFSVQHERTVNNDITLENRVF